MKYRSCLGVRKFNLRTVDNIYLTNMLYLLLCVSFARRYLSPLSTDLFTRSFSSFFMQTCMSDSLTLLHGTRIIIFHKMIFRCNFRIQKLCSMREINNNLHIIG